MMVNYFRMTVNNYGILTLKIIGFPYQGNLPWKTIAIVFGANVIKLFTMIIYCLSMVLLPSCVKNICIAVNTIDWQSITLLKSFITLAQGGKHKYYHNLPQHLTLELVGLKLPWLFTAVLFYNIGTWGLYHKTYYGRNLRFP